MIPPIDGTLLITQNFASLKGGPGEAYNAWRDGQEIRCIGHPAIDINCATGTPVYSVKPGIVTVVLGDQFLGNYITLTALDGESWEYGHLSFVAVHTGQQVAAGVRIGLSGSTGNSTGPHLHFSHRPAHPNYANGFDGHDDPMTHFDADVYPLFDLHLV